MRHVFVSSELFLTRGTVSANLARRLGLQVLVRTMRVATHVHLQALHVVKVLATLVTLDRHVHLELLSTRADMDLLHVVLQFSGCGETLVAVDAFVRTVTVVSGSLMLGQELRAPRDKVTFVTLVGLL